MNLVQVKSHYNNFGRGEGTTQSLIIPEVCCFWKSFSTLRYLGGCHIALKRKEKNNFDDSPSFFPRGHTLSLSLSSLSLPPCLFPSFYLTSCVILVNLPGASFCCTSFISKMRIHLPPSDFQQGCCDD